MKDTLKEIIPGQGLGPLKFGMSKSEVKSLLGEASFVEKYEGEEDMDFAESWEYDDLGLSLSFDEEENWRMTIISLSDTAYQLNGMSLIGKSQAELVAFLEQSDLGPATIEDFSSEEMPNHKLVEIDQQSLNFWLNDDKIEEIQLSPLFINDDTIKWPV